MVFHDDRIKTPDSLRNSGPVRTWDRSWIKEIPTVIKFDVLSWRQLLQGKVNLLRDRSDRRILHYRVLPQITHQAMKWALTIGKENRRNTLCATMTRTLILYKKMVGAKHIHSVPRSASGENISSIESQASSGSTENRTAKNSPINSRPVRSTIRESANFVKPKPGRRLNSIKRRLKLYDSTSVQPFVDALSVIKPFQALRIHFIQLALHRKSLWPVYETRIRSQIKNTVERIRRRRTTKGLALKKMMQSIPMFERTIDKDQRQRGAALKL
jgi:hypothetical protein